MGRGISYAPSASRAALHVLDFPRLHLAVHHVSMALFLLSTATATLELTQDSWATEVSDSGKSAFVK